MSIKAFFRIALIMFVIGAISQVSVSAWTLPIDSTYITSDFGPRKEVPTWHNAIDYGFHGVNGVQVKSVERGEIEGILPLYGDYGNRILIRGTKLFSYNHLMGKYPSTGTIEWEIKENITISNSITSKNVNAIIFYNSGTVSKVLIESEEQDSSHPFVYEGSVTTSTSVNEGEYFARGDSTGLSSGPHLHLELNDGGSDNPLLYIPYSNGNNPTITLENPSPNVLLDGEVTLKARINTQDDYDLNKVRFYLSNSEGGQILLRSFDYGGKENENRLNANEIFSETSNGVYPADTGDDKFIYKWNTKEKDAGGNFKYPSGDYNLIVQAEDVKCENGNGSGFAEISVPIKIDHPPTVLSYSPASDSQNISPGIDIIAFFDKNMDASTFTDSTVYLQDMNNGAHISGKMIYDDAQKRLTFTPNSLLGDNTQYKFVMTDSISETGGKIFDGNADGNAGGHFSYIFTTGSASIITKLFKLAPWAWGIHSFSEDGESMNQRMPKMCGIAIDDEENVYIAHTKENKVVKYDKFGNILKTIDSLSHPMGVAVNSSIKRIYIADTFKGRILIYDDQFNLKNIISDTNAYLEQHAYQRLEGSNVDLGVGLPSYQDYQYPDEGFFLPTDVWISKGGELYVCDFGKHRVLKYDGNGNPLPFSDPKKVLVDDTNRELRSGALWSYAVYSNALNDSFNSRECFKAAHITSNENSGNNPGKFNLPAAITGDENGNIYVADTLNHRIQKFDHSGKYLGIVGDSQVILYPRGMSVDRDGNFYVIDGGNNLLRKFKNDGTYERAYGNENLLNNPQKLSIKRVNTRNLYYITDADSDDVNMFGLTPPADFNILLPSNELVTQANNYVLTWSTSEAEWNGLAKYQIYGRFIDGINEPEWGLLKDDIPPDQNSIDITLEADGVYELKVRAVDTEWLWRESDGGSSSGDTKYPTRLLTVKVDTAPPGPIYIASPYDGKYFDGCEVSIEWHRPYDANLDYYEVCIGTDPNDIHGSAIFSENFTPEVTSCEVNLPGGEYYIYIAAYDKAKHWRNLKGETDISEFDLDPVIAFDNVWPMFEIDHTPPLIAYDPTVAPPATNPHFSPNGDGKKDLTVINYYVGDDSYWKVNYLRMDEVRIDIQGEIVNETGEIVRSWEERSPPGWYEFIWDGTSDSGPVTDDGVYTVRITAKDRVLNTATDESLAVVVDNTPPEVNNIANSGIFSPNGDGEFDADTLSFELSDNLAEDLAITVDVLNPADVVIRSLVAGFASVPINWDGTTNDGQLSADGNYTYQITATDQAGNASTSSTAVIIDTTPPAFSDVSTSPQREVTFTETSGALDISFNVSETSNVRMAIYDSNYSIIRDYVVEAEPGVANIISWDGRDSFGSLVPDNSYITYAFSATDQVANSSTYASNDIVKVDTPVTGLAGNIIYSPDGVVKIIVPAGAVAEGTELYLDMFDTQPKTYQVNEKDNITLTYKLYPEDIELNKQATMIIQYDESLLNFEHQPVELWRRGSDWTKLYGNTQSDTFIAYLEKTGEFALFADLTPPAPPVIDQPTSPTNEASIIIAGTAEPYSKVDLWINGLKRSPPINVGSEGTFSADILLSEGLNSIYAAAADQTGNIGEDSEVINVELDSTPPTITLNSPQYIYISPNGDGIQDEAAISASTDGVSIIISVRDSQNNILASSSSGTLTVDGALLTSDGVYPYVVKAFDELGNEARKDGEIIVDTIPPDAYLYSSVITPIVSGRLPLSALADDLNFARYVLDYGTGGSPTSWTWLNESFINVVYQKIADADTALLEDGTYTFRLRVYDKAGNSNSSTLSKQTVNAELYGLISSPTINQVVRGTTEVHGNIIGTNFAEYSLDDGVQTITSATTLPADSLLGTWDTTSVSDGDYTLKLRVINIGGGTSDHSVPVKVDNSPPSVSISSPQLNQVLADTININGAIVDENFSYYKVEYASQANPADWHLIRDKIYTLPSLLAAWNTAAVSDGNYLIRITAVDMVGNSGSSQVQVVVDNTPPAVTISGPSSDDILGGTISITGTVSDNNPRAILLEYRLTASPEAWQPIAALGPTNITNSTIYGWSSSSLNGDYTIRVTAIDKTGKTSSDEVSIHLDNIDPSINITSPSRESVNAGIVDIAGAISDLNFESYSIKYGYGIEPVRWWDLTSDSISKSGTLYSWDTPNVKDGYYTIKIDAVDKAENPSSYQFVITVDNGPAVAQIHEPTSNQVVRDTVAISGVACDADFTTYNFKRFEVLYGAGANPTDWTTIESLVVPKINETLTNWNTTGLADGTYTLKLRAEDISGITEDTRTIVVDNTDPTAIIDSPSQGENVSDSVSITGTASDTNISEYKVYYKESGSSTWAEIGSGNSSLVATTLSTWNTVNVGDGTYSIKLWVKDQAGNEKEITRDVTVNNVLAVVNDSSAPTTISPNGDGVDDVASIAYTLSESSPVTIKIYKKPQYDTFKWEAKGFGTRYPWMDFKYKVSGSGKKHPDKQFTWKVIGNGVENYSKTVYSSEFSFYKWDMWFYGQRAAFTVDSEYDTFTVEPIDWDAYTYYNADVDIYIPSWNPDPFATTSVMWFGFAYVGNINALYSEYKTLTAGDYWADCGYITGGSGWRALKVIQKAQPLAVSEDDSGLTTVSFGSPKTINVSLALPTIHGGSISGQSVSKPSGWTDYDNNSDVSTSLSGSWGGATYTGQITAVNNASEDWSGSSSEISDSCKAGPGMPEFYKSSDNIGNMTGVPSTADGLSFTLSKLEGATDVYLTFVNNAGSHLGTSTSDKTAKVKVWTTHSNSWDTSVDPAVGSGGWIKSGEISLPFNYDESSLSLSTNYTSPSDVILSSWTVNFKNSAGGASADVELDGTPTAGGDFNVKISDSLLVKTLQYNASSAPGAQSIEWDGKDGNGSYVADGDYIYYIYAGPNIVKKSGVIKVERSSEISSASLSEEYISPDGDGIKDSTTIDYTLSEAASVNIDVLDESDTVIKSFSAGGNQGANSTSWDGRNNSGTVVEDGEYTIKINVTNGNGALRTRELALVVDNNSLTVGEIAAEQLASSGNDPVYSPDKSKIAYVKESSGKKQIFTMNLLTTNNLQLTTNGNNFQPAWSPDGTKLTFASDRSGNNDIWIMNSDGSNRKQITSDNDSETSPAFSPDGQKIAYASNRTGQLGINKWNVWTVDLDGTNPAQITADENTAKDDYPSWAPDGKKIAFASDQSGNFDIWRVNLDGSSKIQVTSSIETETAPVWSPDGLKIIYTRENDIYLRKLSSGEEVLIAGGENPAWSRDGTEVVYNAADSKIYSKKVCAGALTGVITQPILNQTLTGLAEIRGTALDTHFESYRLEFSPNSMPYAWVELANSSTPITNGILGVWNTADVADGEYILKLTVNDKAGNSLENTVVVNADNDNWKLTITNLEQITSDEAWDIEPAWSPDGTKLAFSSNRSGNYEIWIMNADGSGLQNITNNSALDVKPAWSPDGTEIAFVSDRSGNKDIWVANADGSGVPLQLTTLTIVDTNPTWSPDGSQMAFASDRSGNFDIWLVNSDGTGTPAKLTSDEALDKEPSWSQFGIAFTSDRSGDKEIWMIEDINNPDPFRLTYNSAEDKEPSWAPIAIPLSDGNSRPLITFTSTRNDNLDIWVMDTDGVDQSKSLTDYTNVDCNPAWSPDGTRVAYASYKDGNYDIWVMNFAINTTALSVQPQQTATLEVIDPKDGKKVETIRPTFEWYGIRGHRKYCAVASRIGETDRNLDKTITSSEANPDETKAGDSRPRIVYQIHEFDEGLSAGNWDWRVQALNDDDSLLAESNQESFEIVPEFTLTGVTNYPNPFNPNRESTKIRYRLGADVDEVKIRIYDVIGSLVKEITNCPTNGEGSSVWDKYQDVDWDGRNGRGDRVRNGIYPFEIVARLGDKSVSARGKVAVLK